MEVYLNSQGELTCSEPQADATVADLVGAVETFCRENVDCTSCVNTCCAGFIVYADHIFLKKLVALAGRCLSAQDAVEFAMRAVCRDVRSGRWFVPQGEEGKCQFLSGKGLCLIYEARPLVCRLHVCYKAEAGYKQLKDELYYAYHEAGKAEMSRWLNGGMSQYGRCENTDNPVFGFEDYGAVIRHIRAWAGIYYRIDM